MKKFSLVVLAMLLTGCVSTNNQQAANAPAPAPVSEQQKLTELVNDNPKDTVALTKLAKLQLKQYQANQHIFYLNKVITTYQELIKRQPQNDDIVLQYYRLNLFKGLAENSYDIAYWQNFYSQYPFLRSVDIAPPEYMEILLATGDGLSRKARIKVLQKTLQANPNFANAYLALAALYGQRDKNELALFILQIAKKYNPENVEIIGPLNDLRVEKLYDNMCQFDNTDLLNQTFSDAKFLVKNAPANAYLHMQLSSVLQLMGRLHMSSFSAKKAASISDDYQTLLLEAQFWNGNHKALLGYFSEKDSAELSTDDLYLNIFFNVVTNNWQKATDLLSVYAVRDEISFYGLLYGAHAYKMLGQKDKAMQILEQGVIKLELKPWQVKLLKYAKDEISDKELFAAAGDRCNQSEALFIQGLQYLQSGESLKYKSNMEAILTLNVYPFYEYAAAKNILKTLNKMEKI